MSFDHGMIVLTGIWAYLAIVVMGMIFIIAMFAVFDKIAEGVCTIIDGLIEEEVRQKQLVIVVDQEMEEHPGKNE